MASMAVNEAQQIQSYGSYLQTVLLPRILPLEAPQRRQNLDYLNRWLYEPDTVSFQSKKRPGGESFAVWDKNGFTPTPAQQQPAVPLGYFWKDMQHLNRFIILESGMGLPVQPVHAGPGPDTWDYRYHTRRGTMILRRDSPDNRHYRIRLRLKNPSEQPESITILVGAKIQDLFQLLYTKYRPLLGFRQQVLSTDQRVVFDAQPTVPAGLVPNHIGTLIDISPDQGPAQESGLPVRLQVLSPYAAALRIMVPPKSDSGLTLTFLPYNRAYPVQAKITPSEPALSQGKIKLGRMETDPAGLKLGQVFQTAEADLKQLLIPIQAGAETVYVAAAGVPKFVALFGRDSLITAWQWLAFHPRLARDTLCALAAYQGKKNDFFNGEAPGKIPHELRQGELSRLGRIPFAPAYASMDATPLFVMLLGDYIGQTGDWLLLKRLQPNLKAALRWIDANIVDNTRDPLYGFLVDTDTSAGKPMRNTAWKDSEDSLRHLPDAAGRLQLPPYPVAWAEVQAYTYGAWEAASRLYQLMAEHTDANPLQRKEMQALSRTYRQKAQSLKARFNRKFWMPDRQFMAIALQADGRPIPSVASNGLHSLLTGLAEPDKAHGMMRRLFQPDRQDLLTRWGVRTLSALEPAFDPVSYHNGSIWPHDNWMIVKGLKRYGFFQAAQDIANRILAAAQTLPDGRLPELYSGFPGWPGQTRIIPYPEANMPQAWASGTPIGLLAEMLGIRRGQFPFAYRFEQPVLPQGLTALDLEDLPLGSGSVSVRISQAPGEPLAQVSLKRLTSPTLRLIRNQGNYLLVETASSQAHALDEVV